MTMPPIEPPDIHHLSAAIGWLELGDQAEAKAELAKINSALEEHPDVLEVRWVIYAKEKNWPAALAAARTLVQGDPARSSGWLHQAYAARRVEGGGVQGAWEALLPAFEKFPDEPTIPYNLSCYACQMQRMDEARQWLQRALKVGDKSKIKLMAMNDPDLKPLWDEIGEL